MNIAVGDRVVVTDQTEDKEWVGHEGSVVELDEDGLARVIMQTVPDQFKDSWRWYDVRFNERELRKI